jgi:hypothetical protein
MGIFSKIMGAIFGSDADASPASQGAMETAGASAGAPAGTSTTAPPSPGSSTPAGQKVDVAKVLDDAVKAKGQRLEWRTSIVDLLKALDIDSSLTARKELARELNYTGDTNDSATMNIWLHRQVIVKLEQNGGKIPADLKD